MDYGKYIIVDGICTQAILFDNTMSHDDFLDMFPKGMIKSAGFFIVSGLASDHDQDDIEVTVFGKSVTLELKSDDKMDPFYIKRILRKSMY